MVKNLPSKVGDKREDGFNPWVGKIPWWRVWQSTEITALSSLTISPSPSQASGLSRSPSGELGR